MGYLVITTGRLRLPVGQENHALDALKSGMAARDGWFNPDDVDWPVESLDDLAAFAASATISRDGDWLVLTTDPDGDPKWSDQATAFYAELSRWVSEGSVTFVGEDEETWTYSYLADGLTQTGLNGWDGSAEPFGERAPDEPIADPPQRRQGWFRRRSQS